ncbi:MAG: Gfo/Idh/MocA family protein [Bacteroidota bacterium]
MTNSQKAQNRRDFLRSFSFYAGSSLLLSAVPWLGPTLKGQEKDNLRPIKLGVIGTGSRGKYLLKHLLTLPDAEIPAVCDNYAPNLNKAIEITKGKARGYKDYQRMIEKEQLDGVIIATPLHWHARMTIFALQAGIHVFCEKSMARNVQDCKAMVETRKQTGNILQIGHQRLFDIKYLKGIERIRKNELGKITQIKAYWHRNNDWRRHVPSPELERKINWRLYKEYSAGLMTELASHQIQVANWVLKEVPEYIMGSGSINFWKDGREVADNVNLVYKYPSGTHLIYDSLISNRFYGLEEQVMGSKGTMEFEKGKRYQDNPPAPPAILQLINDIEHGIFDEIPIGGASWIPETAREYKGEYITDKHPIPNSSTVQLIAFMNSIRENKPIPGMLKEAYYASVAALLGHQAIEEKKIIKWPGDLMLNEF